MDSHFGIGKVESLELLLIVEAELAEHARVGNACVTLTENEAVSVFPLRIGNIILHVLVVENGQHIHNAHAAAYMSAARPISGVKAKVTQLVSLFLKSQPFLLC